MHKKFLRSISLSYLFIVNLATFLQLLEVLPLHNVLFEIIVILIYHVILTEFNS